MRRISTFPVCGNRGRSLVLGLSLVMLLLGWAMPAAADGKKENDKKTKSEYVVSKWAYKRLNEAHQLISKNKYSQAMEVMDAFRGRSRLNPHEQALMWQTIGYIWAGKENFPKAINALNKSLTFDALPEGSALSTEFTLGQLYLASKQYDQAVRMLNSWIRKAKNPSPQAKHMLAMALAQQKNFKHALYWIQQARNTTKKPQESWWQLELSCYYELKQYAGAVWVLKQLVTQHPKKSYWLQLAGVYSELKQHKRALAVLELAYKQGFLTKHAELVNLASMYNHIKVPLKAAEVYKKGLKAGIIKRNQKTLTQYADALIRAREFTAAAEPIAAAAKLSGDGELYLRLAQVYIESQKWTQATGALKAALKKGGLKNTGYAWVLLGVSHFRSNKFKDAKKAFSKAAEFKRSAKSARQWLTAVQQKVARR